MKKNILLLAISVFILCPVLRAEEVSMSLDEALDTALRDNRTVLLKGEDIKKARAKLAEAQAGRLPSLTFTGTYTDTRSYLSKDVAQDTAQATLKQTLYEGGKITNKIEYNKYNLSAAESALDTTKLETVLTVKKVFYTLFLASEYAQLNKGILDNTREHLDSLQASYAKGQASESELLRPKSSLLSVKQTYEASLNQVEASQVLLNSLLYLEKNVKIVPVVDLRYEPQEVIYEEEFAKAMEKRPELKEFEAQIRAGEKAVEIARADNRPTVSASWDYYTRSHLAGSTARNRSDYNVIGITVSWPVFDGWATKAKVEQAVVDLKETQLSREKKVRDIYVELKNAYLDFKNAAAKTGATQAEVDLYKDAFLTAEDKYKAGMISLLDFHDVSLSYEISLFKYKEALYDYIIAQARTDKAIGEIQ